MGTNPFKGESICWSCEKCLPGRGCEWADEFKSVSGWNAIPTIKKNNMGEDVHSFHVIECPKFKKG